MALTEIGAGVLDGKGDDVAAGRGTATATSFGCSEACELSTRFGSTSSNTSSARSLASTGLANDNFSVMTRPTDSWNERNANRISSSVWTIMLTNHAGTRSSDSRSDRLGDSPFSVASTDSEPSCCTGGASGTAGRGTVVGFEADMTIGKSVRADATVRI